MTAHLTYIDKGAQISACGKYRYRLWREWRLHPAPAQWSMWTDERGVPIVDGAGEQLGEPKTCVFVMLNPSTADGNEDDPTIRRCVGFARVLGYDRLEVLNLFAYRATDPKSLLALNHDDDPVGSGNKAAFDHVLTSDYPVGTIICAWGRHGTFLGQDETALGWMGDRACYSLGLTKDGHPKHPLYLPGNAQPARFRP